jgi:GNAT superfamily N-acetyltransferase
MMMEDDKMKINLQSVIDEIESADDGTLAYYDPRTETIVYEYRYDPSASTYDPDEYHSAIPLPDRRRIDDYHNMELFIETVDDSTAAEWLSNAIHGRGAFRMFRAALERFDLTEDWYDFRDRQHRILAIEWCEENGIEYESSYAFLPDEEEDEEEEDNSYGFDIDYTKDRNKPAPKPVSMPKEVRITPITKHNSSNIVYMHADCVKELAALKKIRLEQDIEAAQEEIDETLKRQDPVFAAVKDGRYVGYMILKNDADMLLRALYVRPDYRRKGIGTALFQKAQECAAEEGKELRVVMKPYIVKMLGFLSHNGWDTLAEISIVKGRDEETENTLSLNRTNLKY